MLAPTAALCYERDLTDEERAKMPALLAGEVLAACQDRDANSVRQAGSGPAKCLGQRAPTEELGALSRISEATSPEIACLLL
jgi:hypothetical protein